MSPTRRTLLKAISLAPTAMAAHGVASAATTDSTARLALVVGNNAYASSPLDNATNDARAIAEMLQRAGFGFRLAGYSDPIAANSAMFKLGFTNSLTPPAPQTARVSDGFPDLAGTRSVFCSCSLASGENLTSQSDASVDILTRIPNTATAWGQSIQFSQVLPSMAKPLARSFNSVSIQLLDDDGNELILADNAVVAFTFLLGYKREGATQVM